MLFPLLALLPLAAAVPSPYKEIRWRGGQQCLTVSGTASGDTVYLDKCAGLDTQLWRVTPLSGGDPVVVFMPKTSDWCLKGGEDFENDAWVGTPPRLDSCNRYQTLNFWWDPAQNALRLEVSKGQPGTGSQHHNICMTAGPECDSEDEADDDDDDDDGAKPVVCRGTRAVTMQTCMPRVPESQKWTVV